MFTLKDVKLHLARSTRNLCVVKTMPDKVESNG